jgi:hypothetical protein
MAKDKNFNADPMATRPDFVKEQDYTMPKDEGGFKPRIKVLQAISPECEKGHDRFISGSEAGQLLLEGSVPRLVDGDDGVVVVPLAVRKRFAEYIPRKQGGGFVASYDTREEMEANYTEGNDIQPTIEYLVVDIETDEVFVVPFDSVTKLGVAKKWGGFVEQYKSLEGVQYRIGTQIRKNKANQSYYNFTITPVGWVEKAQYEQLVALQESEEKLFLEAPKEKYDDV